MQYLKEFNKKSSGLLVVAMLAIISYLMMDIPWLSKTGISSLVLAIILGIIFGNTWKHPTSWTPGIQFSAKRILRTAIILYGFRVTFQQIASVGSEALGIDVIVVCSTILIGYFIGRKLFKFDRDLALLISAGSAICGAAAVLAVEDILKSEPYKTSVAIATVVIFGTLSMFLYPVLQHAQLFGFTDNQFGIFAGASIHEVAQALVAGSNISLDTGKVAVVVKMIRVLLLVPVLFVLAFLNSRQQSDRKTNIIIPWFAIGFIIVIGFNSLNLLPIPVVQFINQIDIILLTMAMGAIGIETKLSKMKQAGISPFYLALIIFGWLFGSVFAMVKIF